MEKKPVSHFVAGIIIAAIMIVYSLILNFTGMMANQALGFVSYILLVGGLIYFILQYAKSVDHTATFGKLFSFGFKATAITTLILIIYMYLFFTIFPEYKDKMIDIARENAAKNPQANQEQIEQGMEFFAKNFYLFTIGFTLFFMLIIGAVGSLIGAGIAKKNPQAPFQNPL